MCEIARNLIPGSTHTRVCHVSSVIGIGSALGCLCPWRCISGELPGLLPWLILGIPTPPLRDSASGKCSSQCWAELAAGWAQP